MSFAKRPHSQNSRPGAEDLSPVDRPLFSEAPPSHFPVRPSRPELQDAQALFASSLSSSQPSETMNHVFSQVARMQSQQQKAAGPMFAELSTEETWRELLRWVVQDSSGDFATQMLEIAALATWALESAAAQSEDLEEETPVWNEETPLFPEQPRFLWKPQDRF